MCQRRGKEWSVGSWRFEVCQQPIHENCRFWKLRFFGFELLPGLVSFADLIVEVTQMCMEPWRHPFVGGPRFLIILFEFLDLTFGRHLAWGGIGGVNQIFVMSPGIQGGSATRQQC